MTIKNLRGYFMDIHSNTTVDIPIHRWFLAWSGNPCRVSSDPLRSTERAYCFLMEGWTRSKGHWSKTVWLPRSYSAISPAPAHRPELYTLLLPWWLAVDRWLPMDSSLWGVPASEQDTHRENKEFNQRKLVELTD